MRHRIKTIEEAKKTLIDEAPIHGESLYYAAMEIPGFWTCPGSSSPTPGGHKKGHHVFEGGLAVHTAQVLEGALDLLSNVEGAKFDLVRIACIWHDVGKVFDYEKVPSVEKPTWKYTDHKSLVMHLPKSAMMLYEEVRSNNENFKDEDLDFLLHLVLAHHGRREAGSPVEPCCAEAWAIHAADMLSAHYVEA